MQFSAVGLKVTGIAVLAIFAVATESLAQTNLPPAPPSMEPFPATVQPPHHFIAPTAAYQAPARAKNLVGPGLAFDANVKQYNAKPFEMSAPFSFFVTNVWTNDITINSVKPSCGCTTAQMPSTPWTLHPGDSGEVDAKVNLMGKMGTITKTLTFNSTVGARLVTLRVAIPSTANVNGAPDRKAAMAEAVADPQAIFKNDCVRCHVDKGRNALGEDLYVADCGICHESPHRESIVPDLHALKHPTDLEYWTSIITNGKAHSLMPAFAMSQGGPLTDQQIASLAGYLNRMLSHNTTMTASAKQ